MPIKTADGSLALIQFIHFLNKLFKAHHYYMVNRPSRMVSVRPYYYDPSTKVDSSRHRASVGRTVGCPCDASQQPVGWSGRIGGCRGCDRQGYCDGLPNSLPIG